jgi:hypothetical protein
MIFSVVVEWPCNTAAAVEAVVAAALVVVAV